MHTPPPVSITCLVPTPAAYLLPPAPVMRCALSRGTQVVFSEATLEMVAPSPWPCAGTMKLKILHFSLLFAATTAKDVYFEDAATDSLGAEAVVPAAKLGVNEAPAANHRRMFTWPWKVDLLNFDSAMLSN